MKDPASIFNDVIGPVMIGPSSSHTAASVRIGNLIRQITGGCPKRVVFKFATDSSLAMTYQSQGADFGLAGGVLGFDTSDPRIVHALSLAEQAGVKIEFQITGFKAVHPNLFCITATDSAGREIGAEALSCGGGMVMLRRLAGVPISINGGFYETLLLFDNCPPHIVYACRDHLASRISGHDTLIVCQNDGLAEDQCRTDPGSQSGTAGYIINYRGQKAMPAALLAEVKNAYPVKDTINLAPVLPVMSRNEYTGLFNTASEVLDIANKERLSLAEVAILYETRRSGLDEGAVLGKMAGIVEILRQTLKDSAAAKEEYPNRILGRQARLLTKKTAIGGKVMHHIIRHITLLMEAKSSMKPIVAAPTAGSCGTVPGTLIGAATALGFSEKAVVRAMLAAGLVGVLIAEHSTFSGEIGGCQAECGSASGMAAAGLVQLLGGTAEQALDAASMALQNVFGLTCDPVAGRVEVPCLGKNIMAGTNALAMAELALAGFNKVVPLDETIAAMYQVGLSLPAELRCTGMGGLSITPASRRIERRLGR